MSADSAKDRPLTTTEWFIVIVAVIGFAFDIYELLMLPIIARPALVELLQVSPDSPRVLEWVGYLFWIPAMCGGVFGLIGGWLTDRFGRRQVLVWSILLYATSAFAAGFSTSAWMLLLFRCTTFVGVCLEFVAATAWLAELFPERDRRERVLGWTQAASSIGGFLVTGANMLAVHYASSLPAIYGSHSSWRYTLISGLIPAIPLLLIRPFLPESPLWLEKVARGDAMHRPQLWEIFRPELRRTTLVTTVLMATSYAAAFGGLQMVPQIVPGLIGEARGMRQEARELGVRQQELQKQAQQLPAGPGQADLLKKATALGEQQRALNREAGKTEQQRWNRTQLIQEMGGLVGRMAFAVLAVAAISRRSLLRCYQVPGLILLPVVLAWAGTGSYFWLNVGIFAAGFLVVGQFSFYGNYLPQVFPTRLRGTGEGFAVNVGGRMLGTSAAFLTTQLAQGTWFSASVGKPARIALSAAMVVGAAYLIGLLATALMPEPSGERLES